ncbi:MAG TPA: Gfo/Idh/MocA family oxidoreductase [Solirubrobacterales bacterium]|nr:Gfo/Idh/MocA family oxidoreductase [Solirubrobacterales bacterium]
MVGTGFSARAHLDALARLPGVRAVAVAGRDQGRVDELGAVYGLRPYTDYAELLADPTVDAVHTCTVNGLHFEVNLAALEQGKHVLSEKPLATNSEQSSALAAAATAAADRGVVSGVCFNYRHYPMVAQMREMLRSGEHGSPHFVHGQYLQDWMLLATDWNWRINPEEGGASRAAADIGSHWADLAQYVIDDVVDEVFADLSTLHSTRLRPERDTQSFEPPDAAGEAEPVAVGNEDFGSVLLRFRSGVRGSFTFSQTSAGWKNGLQLKVDAAHGAFSWDQERPDRVWVGRREGANLELLRDPAAPLPGAARPAQLPAGHSEGWADALRNMCADFYAAVHARRDGTEHASDVASFADGDARVALIDAVLASHREQRWMPVRIAGEAPG